MNESNDIQAIREISAEVEDSQVKTILSNQCMKAQSILLDRLRKESERQKQVCKNISSTNVMLQAEIIHAEQEIKSLTISLEIIKSSNIDKRKDLLLAKESKLETIERTSAGKLKYEELWLQCKARYESIPYVQTWLNANNKIKMLNDSLIQSEREINIIIKEIDKRRCFTKEIDKKRVIELAEFLVRTRPALLIKINEKINLKKELENEIDELCRGQAAITAFNDVESTNITTQAEDTKESKELINVKASEEEWTSLNNNNDTISIPKLHLKYCIDLDCWSNKLDQIKKIDASGAPKRSPEFKIPDNSALYTPMKVNADKNFVSSYFSNPSGDFDNKTNLNFYSKRKIINILEDIKIDNNDALNIMSKVKPQELQVVNMIGNKNNDKNDPKKLEDTDANKTITEEVIEEIDISNSNTDNIIGPPNQFLDMSQSLYLGSQQQVEVMVHMSMDETPMKTYSLSQSRNSQEKKKVSFDLPMQVTEIDDDNIKTLNGDEVNVSINSQADVSLVSNESFSKIKDMILKKNNLDLSPPFVYTKNTILQKKNETQVITSKFFNKNDSDKVIFIDEGIPNKKPEDPLTNNQENSVEDEKMEIDAINVSSPKMQKAQEQLTNKDKTMTTGFLFSHGSQGIPELLDVSISTTGFEDGDAEYPQCIDSNLLLSPKGDLSMPMDVEKVEVSSQEVPNFLSGLRKTGLSFFNKPVKSKPHSDEQGQPSNFNFTFGGEDKRIRGGLFNMFH